jgi:signal transduction histidine kinase
VRYVSHEIRTPLNITILGLKYLEDELKSKNNEQLLTPVVQEVLDDVRCSCGIAVDILNDLLLYEKLDDGIFNLSLSDVPIEEFFRDAINVFQVQAKSLQIELIVVTHALNGVVVRLDRMKFSQVLRNLVSNALKFTPMHGTVCPVLRCSFPTFRRHFILFIFVVCY